MENEEDGQDASTDFGPLTQRQAENLADFVYRRNEERMYAKVGRSVVGRFIYAAGAALCALAVWLSGWFHLSVGPSK